MFFPLKYLICTHYRVTRLSVCTKTDPVLWCLFSARLSFHQNTKALPLKPPSVCAPVTPLCQMCSTRDEKHQTEKKTPSLSKCCLCAAVEIRWSSSQKNKDASIIISPNTENPWVMLLMSSAAYYLVPVLCCMSLTDPVCLLTSYPDETQQHGYRADLKISCI